MPKRECRPVESVRLHNHAVYFLTHSTMICHGIVDHVFPNQVVDNSHSTRYFTSVLMYMWYTLKAWLKRSILDDYLARICSSCTMHCQLSNSWKRSQKYVGA